MVVHISMDGGGVMLTTDDVRELLQPLNGREADDIRRMVRLPDPDTVLRKMSAGPRVLDTIIADPKVASVMETRQDANALKPWVWVAGADPGQGPTADAQALRDALATHLSPERMYYWVDEMLDAPFMGTIPVELIWHKNGSGHYIAELMPWESERVDFNPSGVPFFVESAGGMRKLHTIPYGKMVLVRHKPRRKNPYGRRLLSSMFWPVTFKRTSTQYWIKFARRYGIPKTLAWLPENIYDERKDETTAMLEMMVEDAVGVLIEGTQADSKLGGDSDGDLFASLRAAMDAEIAEVALGQPLTSSMPTRGTQALGTVQERVEIRRELYDERMIARTGDAIGRLFRDVVAPSVPAPTYRPQADPLNRDRISRDRDIADISSRRFTPEYFEDVYGIDARYLEDVPPGAQFASGVEEREAVDAFVAEQIRAVSPVSDEDVREIMEKIKSASSYEDVRRAVSSLDLRAPDMAHIIEQALVAAHLYGRSSV